MELRKYSHEERVRMGREICDLILKTYSDRVLAVYIYGSTAKGLDRPYSDLEIVCVVRDGVEIPTRYFVYKGIVVGIDYPQESSILRAAREVKKDWPFEADSYRNRIVLYERDWWLRLLDEAVSESERADTSEALRRAAWELVEDLSVLRNAQLSADGIGVKIRGRAIAQDAARVVFLLNRHYVTTTSRFWKEAFECSLKPQDFQKLVETASSFVPATPDQITSAAEQLCSETLGMAGSRGILIELDRLVV